MPSEQHPRARTSFLSCRKRGDHGSQEPTGTWSGLALRELFLLTQQLAEGKKLCSQGAQIPLGEGAGWWWVVLGGQSQPVWLSASSPALCGMPTCTWRSPGGPGVQEAGIPLSLLLAFGLPQAGPVKYKLGRRAGSATQFFHLNFWCLDRPFLAACRAGLGGDQQTQSYAETGACVLTLGFVFYPLQTQGGRRGHSLHNRP